MHEERRTNSTTAIAQLIRLRPWHPYPFIEPPPMPSVANLSTSGNGNSAFSQYPATTGATCFSLNSLTRRTNSFSGASSRPSKSNILLQDCGNMRIESANANSGLPEIAAAVGSRRISVPVLHSVVPTLHISNLYSYY